MSEETVVSEIEDALQALARADRILDRVGELPADGRGGAGVLPLEAAQVWVARAMCLTIDSLEGVEDLAFTDAERVPVARTREPYTYLSARYHALSERCRGLADEHETGI